MGIQVIQLFSDFCKAYGRQLELRFEPGKYLTAQAGRSGGGKQKSLPVQRAVDIPSAC